MTKKNIQAHTHTRTHARTAESKENNKPTELPDLKTLVWVTGNKHFFKDGLANLFNSSLIFIRSTALFQLNYAYTDRYAIQ